jgi:hypothetical protein
MHIQLKAIGSLFNGKGKRLHCIFRAVRRRPAMSVYYCHATDTIAFYAFCAPDFFRKYRAKKDMEKPIRTSDTATHI